MPKNTILLPFTVAVDFDGVVHTGKYPEIGAIMPFCKEILDEFAREDTLFILNTCRSDQYLREVINFCLSNKLPIRYFNQNDPQRVRLYGGDSRKISADAYIDDKNVPGGFPGWLEIADSLWKMKKNYEKWSEKWSDN